MTTLVYVIAYVGIGFFLIAVALRYAWSVYRAVRFGVEEPDHDALPDST